MMTTANNPNPNNKPSVFLSPASIASSRAKKDREFRNLLKSIKNDKKSDK